MLFPLLIAVWVPALCTAHRRLGHETEDLVVRRSNLGQKGHLLQQQFLHSDSRFNNEVEARQANLNGLKVGLLVGIVVLIFASFAACCYFHMVSLQVADIVSLEAQSAHARAAKEQMADNPVDGRDKNPVHPSPDSSPNGESPNGNGESPDRPKMKVMVKKFQSSGLDLDGEPPGPVRVHRVEEASIYHLQGVRVGDRVVKIGKLETELYNVEDLTPEDFEKILTSGPVHFHFQRFRFDAAGSFLAGLSRWTSKAKQSAAALMAKEEEEIKEIVANNEEDWADGLPEAEKRVFPRPNPVRYKWVLRTCFEHDWKFIRPRLLRDFKLDEAEINEAEQCLRSKYMWVLPLYRKLSSEETSEGGSSPENISQFGVSKRSIMRILGTEGIDILDKTTMTQARASELYKQANFTSPQDVSGFSVRCDSVLCRYQFAELLVRIAVSKWSGKSKVSAVETLFEELAVLCQKYSGDMRELLTSGSSDTVQAVYEAIEPQTWAVFVEMASIHENMYGQKYMTLQDWRNLLNRINIFVLYPVVKRKYGAYTYRMGLEPQADEQYNKTWQLMSFLEFQRALGAVMFLSEMRPKKECKPEVMATLLQKIAKDNLSQVATPKLHHRASLKQ